VFLQVGTLLEVPTGTCAPFPPVMTDD